MKTTFTLCALAALLLLPGTLPAATCGDQLVTGVEGEAQANDNCADQSDSTTLCLGDEMCQVAYGSYEYPDNGSCVAGTHLVTLGNVDDACDAATSVTEPANCNGNCVESSVQEDKQKTARCCTIKLTRVCVPPEA